MAKKPTGPRPKPQVTGTVGIKSPKMNKTKPAIKHTSMGGKPKGMSHR